MDPEPDNKNPQMGDTQWRQIHRRIGILSLFGVLTTTVGAAFVILDPHQSIGVGGIFFAGLLAFALVSFATLRMSGGPRPVFRVLDITVSVTFGATTAIGSIAWGGLASPAFLVLAGVVAARAYWVPTSARWTITSLFAAWVAYPTALFLFSFASSNLALAWTEVETLARLGFALASIAALAAVGLMLRWFFPTNQQRPKTEAVDDVWDLFEKLEFLDRDNTGEIFLAEQKIPKRQCLVKLLRRDLTDKPEALKRFGKEAALPARLIHPNIIQVFAVGEQSDGRPYFATEYMKGLTLTELVNSIGPVTPPRTLHLVLQLGKALEFIHENGFVYGNLSPDNTFVTISGNIHDSIKLVDFGLVRRSQLGRSATRKTTARGSFERDPHFTAPEVVMGREADPRSDIYSLAAIAYYLLSGRTMFSYQRASKILQAQLVEDPKTLTTVGHTHIPPDLEFVISRALSKLPDYRYRSMEKFIEALKRCHVYQKWDSADARSWWDGDTSEHRKVQPEPKSSEQHTPTRPTQPDHLT